MDAFATVFGYLWKTLGDPLLQMEKKQARLPAALALVLRLTAAPRFGLFRCRAQGLGV